MIGNRKALLLLWSFLMIAPAELQIFNTTDWEIAYEIVGDNRNVYCGDDVRLSDTTGSDPDITLPMCQQRCLDDANCNFILFGIEAWNHTANRCTLFTSCDNPTEYLSADPKVYRRTFSEKCRQNVIITSSGLAKAYHCTRLGIYKDDGVSNGHISYKNANGFYLYFALTGRWMVSSEKGIESGYFDSDCKVNCPQNCNGTWKTWKNIDYTWEIDSTLTITRPECGHDVECIAGYTCRDGSCVNEKICNTVIITSKGIAKSHHFPKLGKYTKHRIFNGRISYKHPEGYYLHFNLHGVGGLGGWVVTNETAINENIKELNSLSGYYFYSRCNADRPDNCCQTWYTWKKYVSSYNAHLHGTWELDATLTVTCQGNDTLYETKEETETNECIAECKSGSPQFLNCREGCAEMTECQGRCKAAYTDDLKQAVCLFKTCLPNGKYMKQNNYYCSPGQKMTSTNLLSAKQECTKNPHCDMFYDERMESSVFYMCESSAYVWMSSTNSIGSTLYYDGTGAFWPSVMKTSILTENRWLWLSSNDDTYMKAYAFDIKNSMKILQGGKPEVQEVGPYVYELKTIKDSDNSLRWHDSDDTITYRPRKVYVYKPEKSCTKCDPDKDILTLPNIPYWTALNGANKMPSGFKRSNIIDFTTNKKYGRGTPFINVTFSQYLWGYEDEFPCLKIQDKKPSECDSEKSVFRDDYEDDGIAENEDDGWGEELEDDTPSKEYSAGEASKGPIGIEKDNYKIPNNSYWEKDVKPRAEFIDCKCNWGFFREENITMKRAVRIHTGSSDKPYLKGLMTSYNNKNVFNWWQNNSVCDEVKGQDLSSLPSGLAKDSSFEVFNEHMCRTLEMSFEKEINHAGIRTFRYIPPPNALGAHDDENKIQRNEANKCYDLTSPNYNLTDYKYSRHFKSGVMNLENCKKFQDQTGHWSYPPLAISQPHFYQADESFRSSVRGLKPDKEKHQFYIDILPEYGWPLAMMERFQSNLVIFRMDDVPELANIKQEIVLPFFWAESGYKEASANMTDAWKVALETTAKYKRSYLKAMETDPPGGTELRFTMTPSDVAQGINARVVFTQLKKGLRLNVELSVTSKNKHFNFEDRVISETNCSSKMPHLYIIKDTSCCTEPTHLKCTSVYGMKLECLLGSGSVEKMFQDLIYYDVENYCVAITSQEVPNSNPSAIMKRSVTKISETSDGFQKLDWTSVPLLSTGTDECSPSSTPQTSSLRAAIGDKFQIATRGYDHRVAFCSVTMPNGKSVSFSNSFSDNETSISSLDDQRVVFDTSDEKRCKVNIVSAIGKDNGMWHLNVALCRKDKKKQHHNFKITIDCEDEEYWCTLAKPDCSVPYTKQRCKKYCGGCQEWANVNGDECSLTECGPQKIQKTRKSITNTENCGIQENEEECALNTCIDESFDDEERALVDVMMDKPTITDCSVNCGEGFKTNYTVICKGAEKKAQRSGKETLNYRIDDILDCRTEMTKTACIGNAGECKGNVERDWGAWTEWSPCSDTCLLLSSHPKKFRTRLDSKNNFTMKEAHLCENIPLCEPECPTFTSKLYSTSETRLTYSMNITMHKAIMPYGRVIRQEIQLIPDTRNRTFLPWVSPNLISGGIRKTKKVFFTKWEEKDNYNDTKMIKKLPINEEFKTITRVYGSLSQLENISEDRFITFDCAKSSKNISTNIWRCLKSLEEIQSSQVCDGKLDCCLADGPCFDKSDEEPEKCKGSNNKLVLLSKCVFITTAILGYLVTIFVWSPVIVKIPIVEDIISRLSMFNFWSPIISKMRCSTASISDVFDEPKELNDLDEVTFNLLLQVCKNFEDWSNFNGGECPTESDFTDIRRLYKSLHDENEFGHLRSIHRCIKNFSAVDDFKYTCQKITDSLIAFEHEDLHKNEDIEISNQCINNVLCGYWSIADYVIEAREAGGIFARIKRYLKNELETWKAKHSIGLNGKTEPSDTQKEKLEYFMDQYEMLGLFYSKDADHIPRFLRKRDYQHWFVSNIQNQTCKNLSIEFVSSTIIQPDAKGHQYEVVIN